MTDTSQTLPKRFYKHVTFEAEGDAHIILLDNKPVKTPLKSKLSLPTLVLTKAVVQEWEMQQAHIDPATMMLTKLANTALDRVASRKDEIVAEIVKYAASDLICYRADGPGALVARQNTLWNPVLERFHVKHDLVFQTATGILFVEQPEESLNALTDLVSQYDDFCLCALHNMTTLTGSALLCLTYVQNAMGLEEVWHAAHVDEDWQIEQWGEDALAKQRRDARWADMLSAGRFFELSQQ